MNRKEALKELDGLFKLGFSELSVRGLINKIYDSIERSQHFSQPNIQVITNTSPSKGIIDTPEFDRYSSNTSEKLLISYDEIKMRQVLNRTDIKAYTKLSHKYEIHSIRYGKMYYFPKADKVHITKGNQWESPGFNWLFKNIV